MSNRGPQIRQPLNSRAQVTITVVDTNGVALGIVRVAGRADLRHRRLPAEGADGDVSRPAPSAASDLAAAIPARPVRGFPWPIPGPSAPSFADPNALTGKTAFSAPLDRRPCRAAVSRRPGRRRPTDRCRAADLGIFASLRHRPAVRDLRPAQHLERGRPGATDAHRRAPLAATRLAAERHPDLLGRRADLPQRRAGRRHRGVRRRHDQDDMIRFLGIDGAATALGTTDRNAPPRSAPISWSSIRGGGANRLRYVSVRGPVPEFLRPRSLYRASKGMARAFLAALAVVGPVVAGARRGPSRRRRPPAAPGGAADRRTRNAADGSADLPTAAAVRAGNRPIRRLRSQTNPGAVDGAAAGRLSRR